MKGSSRNWILNINYVACPCSLFEWIFVIFRVFKRNSQIQYFWWFHRFRILCPESNKLSHHFNSIILISDSCLTFLQWQRWQFQVPPWLPVQNTSGLRVMSTAVYYNERNCGLWNSIYKTWLSYKRLESFYFAEIRTAASSFFEHLFFKNFDFFWIFWWRTGTCL